MGTATAQRALRILLWRSRQAQEPCAIVFGHARIQGWVKVDRARAVLYSAGAKRIVPNNRKHCGGRTRCYIALQYVTEQCRAVQRILQPVLVHALVSFVLCRGVVLLDGLWSLFSYWLR